MVDRDSGVGQIKSRRDCTTHDVSNDQKYMSVRWPIPYMVGRDVKVIEFRYSKIIDFRPALRSDSQHPLLYTSIPICFSNSMS